VERESYVAARREEYEEDIDILRLAADLVVDAVVEPSELRDQIIARFAAAAGKDRSRPAKRHGVPPV
jgi:acetyl-CoA carboxylase carboxyltransferase component